MTRSGPELGRGAGRVIASAGSLNVRSGHLPRGGRVRQRKRRLYALGGQRHVHEALAQGLPGIVRIEARDATVMAYAERPGEAIPPLLRLAEQAGRVVKDIHLSPPSLETLFVAMTGRGLQ